MVKRSKIKQLNNGKSKLRKKENGIEILEGGATTPPTKMFKEERTGNSRHISNDIDNKYSPDRDLKEFNATTGAYNESLPTELIKLAENNTIIDTFNDTESKDFVKIFKFFAQKKFTSLYNNIDDIIDSNGKYAKNINDIIQKEDNNKVIIIKNKLYLYNIDLDIDYFIKNSLESGTRSADDIFDADLRTQYEKFLKTMTEATAATGTTPATGHLTEWKKVYLKFGVIPSDSSAGSDDPHMFIYMPKLLTLKSSLVVIDGSMLQNGGAAAVPTSKDIINAEKLSPGASEYISKLNNGTSWIKINNNKNNPTNIEHTGLYSVNTKFAEPAGEFSITNKRVQNYLLKCEDLQIFYINKHIELYKLFKKVAEIIKYNKSINDITLRLLNPTAIITTKTDRTMIKIKGTFDDINKYTGEQKKILASLNDIFPSDDITIIKVTSKNRNDILQVNETELKIEPSKQTEEIKKDSTITVTCTLKERYGLKKEYVIIKSDTIPEHILLGRVIEQQPYTNNYTKDTKLTITVLFNDFEYNLKIPLSKLYVVNYASPIGNLKYNIADTNASQATVVSDASRKNFYILNIPTNGIKLKNGVEITTGTAAGTPTAKDMLLTEATTGYDKYTNFPIKTTTPAITGNNFIFEVDLSQLTLDMKLEEASTVQRFDGTQNLGNFGNNIYYAFDVLENKKLTFKVVTFSDFIKYFNNNEPVKIKFGRNFDYFMDYMFSDSNRTGSFNLVNTTGTTGTTSTTGTTDTDFNFTIEDIYYKEASIKIRKDKNDTKKLESTNPTELNILIPNLKRYVIKFGIKELFGTTLINNQTVYYYDGTNKMMMTYKKDSATASASASDDNEYFTNLNIPDTNNNDKKQYIDALIAKCNKEKTWTQKNVFNLVDYYVDSIDKFETLQIIQDLQLNNLSSLKKVLGFNEGDPTTFDLDKKVAEYKSNINKQKFTTIQETSVTNDGWKNFGVNNSPDTVTQYFSPQIQSFGEATTTDNPELVQQVIYRCYDLQILYLIKHLEVIEIFKIIFYYVDMLVKQVALVMFILALYKRYKFDINDIGEVTIRNFFTNIGEMVKVQTDTVVGDIPGQAGGSGNVNPAASGNASGANSVVTSSLPEALPEALPEQDKNQKFVKYLKEKFNTETLTKTYDINIKAFINYLTTTADNVGTDITDNVGTDIKSKFTTFINSIEQIKDNTDQNLTTFKNLTEKIKAFNSPKDTTQASNAAGNGNTPPKPYANATTELPTTEPNANATSATYGNVEGGNLNMSGGGIEDEIYDLLTALQNSNISDKTIIIKTIIEKINAIHSLLFKINLSKKVGALTEDANDLLSIKQFIAEHKDLISINSKELYKYGVSDIIKLSSLDRENAKLILGSFHDGKIKEFREKFGATTAAKLQKTNPKLQTAVNAYKSFDLNTYCKNKTCSAEAIKALKEKQNRLTEDLFKETKLDSTSLYNYSDDINVKAVADFLAKNPEIFMIPDYGTDKEKYKLLEKRSTLFDEIIGIINNTTQSGGSTNPSGASSKNTKNADTIKAELLAILKEGKAKIEAEKVRLNQIIHSGDAAKEAREAKQKQDFENKKKELTEFVSKIKSKFVGNDGKLVFDSQDNINTLITETVELVNSDEIKNLQSLDYSDENITKLQKGITKLNESFTKTYNTIKTYLLEKLNGFQTELTKLKDYNTTEINGTAVLEYINGYIKNINNQSALYNDFININKLITDTTSDANPTKIIVALNEKKLKSDAANVAKKQLLEQVTEILANNRIKKILEITNSTTAKATQAKKNDILDLLKLSIPDITILADAKTLHMKIDTLSIEELQQKKEEIIAVSNKIKDVTDDIFSQINTILSSRTRDDVEAIPHYESLIKQLGIVWSNIKPTKGGNLEAEVKSRIDESAELIGGGITKDFLIEIMKKAYEIYAAVIVITGSVNEETYKTFTTRIKTFTTNESEKLTKIEENIRVLYETIMGAAMVIVRIKPLIPHNTAPTYGEIKKYIEQNKIKGITTPTDYKEFTVRDYLAMKGRDHKTVLDQQGGYKYEDIIKIDEKTGIINIADFCTEPLKNQTQPIGPYGPFAGIYTPEYNNFDIYAYLFGTEKLGDPQGNSFNSPSDLATASTGETIVVKKVEAKNAVTAASGQVTTEAVQEVAEVKRAFGSLPYTNNNSQKLMKKLTDGGNVVLFGYGFSGSGKTYALLEGNKQKGGEIDEQKYDPSLLEQFIKDNSQYITSIEFLDIYPLGIKNDNGNQVRIFCGDITNKADLQTLYGGVGYYQSEDIYNTIKKKSDTENITFDEITKRISDLETHRRKFLRICATPNNDSSSRSFLQITVNLKRQVDSKYIINKMIFFDMPGTENTVRIRTEFLGTEVFDSIKNYKNLTNAKTYTNYMLHKEFFESFNVKDNASTKLVKITLQNFQKFEEYKQLYDNLSTTDTGKPLVTSKDSSYHNLLFKDSLAAVNSFNSFAGITNMTAAQISLAAQEITLFLNGYTIKNIFELNNTYINKNIYLLSNKINKDICTRFINNVIFRPKEGESKQGEYMYFTLIKKNIDVNDNDELLIKIKSETEQILDTDSITYSDMRNIEQIFEIPFKQSTTELCWRITESNGIGGAIKKTIINYRTLYDLKNYINSGKSKDQYVYIPTEKNKSKQHHPLIKYFLIIMNTIIDSGVNTEAFYGILIFYIYKYINFIVKQGSAIVTNLEHLKFFFLSNTNNVEKYNNNKNADNSKKYLCEENQCNDLIDKPYTYITNTKITDTVNLDETINMGNMGKYRLLSILQSLANQNSNLDQLATKVYKNKADANEYTLDLFTSKSGTIFAPQTTKKSLFVMFTNIKIFRDDSKTFASDLINSKDDDKLKPNLELLCAAEYDTLEFAQSISSTTQGAATAVASGGSKTKSNNIKYFSMNELNKKNKNHKTRRNFSITNKKHKIKGKMFSTHSKKNIH